MVTASTVEGDAFVTPAGRVKNVTYHTRSVKTRRVVGTASVLRALVCVRLDSEEFAASMVSTSSQNIQRGIFLTPARYDDFDVYQLCWRDDALESVALSVKPDLFKMDFTEALHCDNFPFSSSDEVIQFFDSLYRGHG